MTTTSEQDWDFGELHKSFSEILANVTYSRLRTLNNLNHKDTKAKSDRLIELLSIFTLGSIITMPKYGEESPDLETRIGQLISAWEELEETSVGVTEHDLLKYELKELSYIFLSKIDIRHIEFYFKNLCVEPSEKHHYDEKVTLIQKAMVIIAVLFKTTDIYNDLVEYTNQQNQRPRRERKQNG